MPQPSPTPPASDDGLDLEKAIEKAVSRAELAEEKNRLYEEQINVLRGRLSDKEEIITILKSQKGDLGEAGQLRREARAIDLERIADRDKLIAKQDAEIERLRHPGFLASIFDKRTAYGGIAGFAACKITNGGTTVPTLPFSQSQFFNVATPADYSMFQTSQEERVRQALKRMKGQ